MDIGTGTERIFIQEIGCEGGITRTLSSLLSFHLIMFHEGGNLNKRRS